MNEEKNQQEQITVEEKESASQSAHTQEHTENNGPKVIYVEKPRKPFPWKAIGKYALVFTLAGLCGFGGGLLANYVDRQKTSGTSQYQENTLPSIPGFGDYNYENGNDSSNGSGHVENTNKAALGVSVREMDDGVYIAGFSQDSNAESAGLKINDKIVAIDGNKYNTYNDIVNYIGTKNVGNTVEVTIERDGEEKKIKVELCERSTQSSLPSNSDSSVY